MCAHTNNQEHVWQKHNQLLKSFTTLQNFQNFPKPCCRVQSSNKRVHYVQWHGSADRQWQRNCFIAFDRASCNNLPSLRLMNTASNLTGVVLGSLQPLSSLARMSCLQLPTASCGVKTKTVEKVSRVGAGRGTISGNLCWRHSVTRRTGVPFLLPCCCTLCGAGCNVYTNKHSCGLL